MRLNEPKMRVPGKHTGFNWIYRIRCITPDRVAFDAFACVKTCGSKPFHLFQWNGPTYGIQLSYRIDVRKDHSQLSKSSLQIFCKGVVGKE